MKNINITFNDLESLSKLAFDSILKKNDKKMIEIEGIFIKIDNQNYGVGEIFRQEFSFYFNKLQINHYLKCNEIIQFPKIVHKMPSLWIDALINKTKQQIKKSNLDLNGIRNFDAKKIINVINKFTFILSIINDINDINEIKANNFLENANEFKHYGEIEKIEDIQKKFLYLIYISAGMITFNKVLNEDNKLTYLNEIFSLYYDKDINKNSKFFNNYLDYDIKKDKLKVEIFCNKKLNFFLPNQNDLIFLSFLKSKVGVNLFNKSILDLTKIEKENINQKILTQFEYHFLNDIISKNESKINKKSKM